MMTLFKGFLNTSLLNMCKINMQIVGRKLKWLVIVTQPFNGRLYSVATERNIKRTVLPLSLLCI